MNNKDILRILHFTDTHLSADAEKIYYGVNTDESLGRVIRHAHAQFPDAELALVTGDLVHDDSREGYERLKRHFGILDIPVFCLPGNHDLPELMNEVLSDDKVQTGRAVLRKSWQILLLDSTVTGEVGGHLDQRELDAIEHCLCEHPVHHALICLHHSPFLTGSYWLDNGLLLDNPEDLFAVLDRHEQVRCVLWGHIHQEFYMARNNVDYIATPSTMIQFKPNSHDFAVDDKPPAFRWLDLYPDGHLETGVVYL